MTAKKVADSHLILSILIPAYCYAEGVIRIFKKLSSKKNQLFEIIINDDSSNNEIELFIADWALKKEINLSYIRNQPALGAAGNWNSLLDKAKGEYCLLLHHDEFLLSEDFLNSLIYILEQYQHTDVFLLNCILATEDGSHYRQHVPMWLRSLVIKKFPEYLFCRNVVGPTSSLVIRRNLYPRFDISLRWLIDVDLYYRIFSTAKVIKTCSNLSIGSLLGRPDSITANLKSSLKVIALHEITYLHLKHPAVQFWIVGKSKNISDLIITKTFYILEKFFWFFLRFSTRILSRIYVSSHSISQWRKSFKN